MFGSSTATTREAWLCCLLVRARRAAALGHVVASWSLDYSNFDRLLHTSSELGPELCALLGDFQPPQPAGNQTTCIMPSRLLFPAVVFASGVASCWRHVARSPQHAAGGKGAC
jgi:hypothetical protein